MSMVISVVAPVLVGLAYIALCALLAEPARQKFNAIMVAGAGAAYLSSGGMGLWEIVFTTVVTFCAFKGLSNYRWLGVAWLLHAGWDVVHYLKGIPIIPAFSHSSFGCAICDPVIAIWMFRGAPPIRTWQRARPDRRAGSRSAHHDHPTTA
jgi:hypothetical protein